MRITDKASFVSDKEAADVTGHGTHVAGIVAGQGKADERYMGIAPGCTLLSGKVMEDRGSVGTVGAGIEWAVLDQHADIINLSLGIRPAGSSDADLLSLIEVLAKREGTIFCVAAGNEGPSPYTITCPADSPHVISVGALSKEGAIPDYSSRGPLPNGEVKPDLTAPGGTYSSRRCAKVGVISARSRHSHPEINPNKRVCLVGNHYIAMSGTSMAAPHVTGASAILLEHIRRHYGSSTPPTQAAAWVRSALLSTARSLGEDPCAQGYGLLRLDRALESLSSEPPAPPPPLKPKEAPHHPWGGDNGGLTSPLHPAVIEALHHISKSYVLPSLGITAQLCLRILRRSPEPEAERLLSLTTLRHNLASDLMVVYIVEGLLPSHLRDGSLRSAAARALVHLGWREKLERRGEEEVSLAKTEEK